VDQEDGAVRGYVRTLTTFGDKVVAVRQVAGNEELVVWNGQLSAELGKYQLRGGTHALGVTVLKSWTVHPQLGDSTTVTRDIAVTECAEGLCIVPIDTNGSFLNYEALYVKTPGGRPVSVQGDKDTNLLFVADGTSGLTIIDLASLGASRDDDGDGVDDRVLGTTDLDGGARAQKVAVWRDIFGKLMVAVAAGRDGIFIVDPPAPPSPTPSWQLSITQPAGQLPSVPIGPQPQTPQITVQAEITGVTLQPGQTVAFKWNAVMKSRFESCNNATSTVLARETRSDFIRKKGEKSDPKVPALVDTYNVPFTNGIEGNELTVSVTAAVCGSGQSTASKVIKIPGTNPSRSAIQGALGIDMLRQIACLESGQCQFDATPSGGIEMCPRFSGDGQGGVGVMQITVPVNGSEPSYADHWDWTANVNSGLAKWNYALPFAQGYPASIKPTSRWVSLVNNLNLYREASGGTCASPLSDVQLQFTAQQVAEDAARVYNGLTDSDGFTHNLHEYRLQIQTVNVPNQGNVELPNVTPVGQVAPTPVDCSYTGAVQVVWERSPCVLRKHAPDAAAASYVENALLQAPTCPSPACQPQVPAQQCAGWAP
jgi:hypothetical protein